MQTSTSCRSWCEYHSGPDCRMDAAVYTTPRFLQGRERLAGIETDRHESNELHVEAGTEFLGDEDEPEGLWVSLTFRYQYPDDETWVERAVVDTDLPGMKTVHAQLGRFLAVVRSGDAHQGHGEPGTGAEQGVAWKALDRSMHHFDDCQPWCRDHQSDGCTLKTTLARTVAHQRANLVYQGRGSGPVPTHLVAVHAIFTPGAEGNRGRFYMGLDCWNLPLDENAEYPAAAITSIPVKMPDLKRIHTRLGKLLVVLEEGS